MDEYIGIIKLFAGSYAPQNYEFCAGQTLGINQYQTLFAIIGTTYGGNGQTNFMLPDLRSRVAVGAGQGIGLSNYIPGEVIGTENNSILLSNMPPHNHAGQLSVNSGDSTVSTPVAGNSIATPGAISGRSFVGTLGYNAAAPNVVLNNGSVTTGISGSGIPVNNIQPSLGLNYIICVNGIYPPRP
ncbi:phage tail protein [Flavobacterium sp. '19STA2R22 D10 B1']|uniref:phage tail protein n=1 Tax=Flavobacterium aerium TaxID=3037261 RepID=UPI00278C06AA|nr:tail fiber protein [Flavobacterium sp. '19STA2R22 D10 B1']